MPILFYMAFLSPVPFYLRCLYDNKTVPGTRCWFFCVVGRHLGSGLIDTLETHLKKIIQLSFRLHDSCLYFVKSVCLRNKKNLSVQSTRC